MYKYSNKMYKYRALGLQFSTLYLIKTFLNAVANDF